MTDLPLSQSSSPSSGESERRNLWIGVRADHYCWCYECASSTLPVPADVEDVPMRGNALSRCSFCGRKLSEVPG